MPKEALPTSLQESLLALLMFDSSEGAAVAAQVRPEHFDSPYQEIARRVLAYRDKYHKPPGAAQIDDLFGWALQEGKHQHRLKRLITGIFELREGINPTYVASRAQNFIRHQSLKAAIISASQRYEQEDEDVVPDVEQILHSALHNRVFTIDAGTRLSDINRAFRFYDSSEILFKLKVKAFDNRGIGVAPKELLLYIGPKNSGKSWFCVHVGVQALKARQRVLHLTLEMREEQVVRRYYQRWFSASWRERTYDESVFRVSEEGKLLGQRDQGTRQAPAAIVMASGEGRHKLTKELRGWETELGAGVIKEYPTGALTMSELHSYLDYLENKERFVPTVLIVDYPDLARIDPRNYRLEIGAFFEQLRGLAVERNIALVAPTQGNRSSLRAKRVRADMAAEDIRKVNAADTVITYSQTPSEHELQLARVYLEYVRSGRRDITAVISQSYTIGQWVMKSATQSIAYRRSVDDPEA